MSSNRHPLSSSTARAVSYIPPAKRKQQQQQQQQQQQRRPKAKANAKTTSTQQERFHGAFTGGFSAGYFNTVDTKEGWKPSTEQRREQKLEDFMDDQDHHEWGGPTTVNQDYTTNSSIRTNTTDGATQTKDLGEASASTTTASLKYMLAVVSRPLTVGPRLLRQLGWREGAGAAFVPEAEVAAGRATILNENNPNDDDDDDNSRQLFHLSQKRLRKIQLQSSRIKLPRPKLDHCGLGFEALEKAPEFQRYRQQRQEMARLRARGQSNVYRVSNVVGGGGGGADADATGDRTTKGGSGDYVSYETPEDFVGTRTVSGFALRDDEDDAYDPLVGVGGDRNTTGNTTTTGSTTTTKPSLLSDEYHTEIVELDEDSDIEDDMLTNRSGGTHSTTHNNKKSTNQIPQATKQMNAILGGALASWATGGGDSKDDNTANTTTKQQQQQQQQQDAAAALTSSGRPPVAGFRLGGSMDSLKKRYPGPDLPRDRDYQLKRHVFAPHERPAIFQTIGRALQLAGEEQAKQQRYKERQEKQQQQQQQPAQVRSNQKNPPLLAGNQFATLATAMKNRFTSESAKTTSSTAMERVGLYQPPSVQAKDKDHKNDVSSASIIETSNGNTIVPKPVVVRRTTHSFAPLPLLCKRFGVPVPRQSQQTIAASAGAGRITEAVYFEKEVLSTAREGAAKVPTDRPNTANNTGGAVQTTKMEEDEPPLPEVPRPSREKLKSIFEPDSDEASSSSSSDDTDLDSLPDGDKSGYSTTQGGPPKEENQKTVVISGDHASEMVLVYSTRKNNDQTELVEYQGGRELQIDSPSTKRETKDDIDDSSSAEDDDSSSRHRGRKRKRSHKKHKKKKKRKRSRRSEESASHDERSEGDESSTAVSEQEEGKERKRETKERRHKYSKKRKKKHSSRRSHRK